MEHPLFLRRMHALSIEPERTFFRGSLRALPALALSAAHAALRCGAMPYLAS